MTLQDEKLNRYEFRTMADPIKAYFIKNGLGELESGVMAANIVSELQPSFLTIFKQYERQARIDELERVARAADKVERQDHCGCDSYVPDRISELSKQETK